MMDGNGIAFSMSEYENIKDPNVLSTFKDQNGMIERMRVSSSMAATNSSMLRTTTKKGKTEKTDNRALEQKKEKKEKKKRNKKKKIIDGPEEPPNLPQRVRDKIKNELGGSDPTLILQKELTATDVNRNSNRLSIPINKLESTEFLEDAEKALASNTISYGGRIKIKGFNVAVIDPGNVNRNKVEFKEWKVGASYCYVLTGSWHEAIVVKNRLKAGQVIQVWFFRDADRKPCFAIVKLDSPQA